MRAKKTLPLFAILDGLRVAACVADAPGSRHGRDHKLIVWRLAEEDEQDLDVVLPVEHVAQPHRQPWILYLVEVNTLNFCSFAACTRRDRETLCGPDASSDILVAVPNTLASEAVSLQDASLHGHTRDPALTCVVD